MKVLTVTLAICLTGCTSPPQLSSLDSFEQTCVKENSSVIRSEWNRYEFDQFRTVVYPNWRTNYRDWAEAECRLGRRIASFHP